VSTPERTSVLIAGAGPTGLAAANLLGRLGIRTTVIEQNGDLCEEPRAVSVDDEAMRLLQQLGLAEAARSVVRPGTGTRFYGRGGQLLARSPAAEEQVLGHPVKNPIDHAGFQRFLCDALDSLSCVDVCFRTSLSAVHQDGTGVIAAVIADGRGDQVRADYLLGCDGGRSTTRRSLGISMQGSSAPDRWLVVDLRRDLHDQRYAMHYGDPRRPHVIVPRGAGQCRYEFLILPGEDPDAAKSFDFVRNLVGAHRGGEIAPDDVVRKHVYEFHAVVASRWQVGRVFLLGDAAHMMPPFGGQGLNSGLKDATNLAWKLAAVLNGQLADTALGSYERERRPNAEATVRYSQMRGRLMMTTSGARAVVRDGLVRAGRSLGFIRRRLDHLPAKPYARYQSGMVVRDEAGDGIAGEILPQPDVLRADGTFVPLDKVLGPGFSLLGVDLGGPVLDRLRSAAWDRLDVRRVQLIIGERFPDGAAVSTDDQLLSAFLGRARGRCVVVRPDRFVLGVFDPAAEAHFVARWQALGLQLSKLAGQQHIVNKRQEPVRIRQ
jgi:3-(3-hydroxy-phenyl)propionate hydroxylase